MKYIRTKESIYETIEYNIKDNIYYIKPIHTQLENGFGIYKSAVIKQADTIKELCDAFVIKIKTGYIILNHYDIKLLEQDATQNGADVYGAIWTDKGLIYVAKMNDKGEFELL